VDKISNQQCLSLALLLPSDLVCLRSSRSKQNACSCRCCWHSYFHFVHKVLQAISVLSHRYFVSLSTKYTRRLPQKVTIIMILFPQSTPSKYHKNSLSSEFVRKVHQATSAKVTIVMIFHPQSIVTVVRFFVLKVHRATSAKSH